MKRYRVTGVRQVQSNGAWFEGGVSFDVTATDHAHAREVALAEMVRFYQADDPLALVRWSDPTMVRVREASHAI